MPECADGGKALQLSQEISHRGVILQVHLNNLIRQTKRRYVKGGTKVNMYSPHLRGDRLRKSEIGGSRTDTYESVSFAPVTTAVVRSSSHDT